MNSAVREFLQAMYGVTNPDVNSLIERFRSDQTNRPATSDMSNFETYLRACAKGQNTTDAFP